jgi:large subunit ribosomal protein L28
MAGTCQVCGKTTTFGHNVSFSKRRTNRSFKANVHRKRLTVDGIPVRVDVCTRCMRTMMKTPKS